MALRAGYLDVAGTEKHTCRDSLMCLDMVAPMLKSFAFTLAISPKIFNTTATANHQLYILPGSELPNLPNTYNRGTC